MNLSKHQLLAEIYVIRTSGLVSTREKDKARRALSLAVQGQKYQDPDGDWWELGTVLHADRQAMIGRREVCAEEGHVLPEKVFDSMIGCKRCDFVFTGSPRA